MCGIAGIIDLKGDRDIDRQALERMTNALEHRGPDGHGYAVEPGFGFGHRRLSIIDLAAGQQPFRAQGGGTLLCFNGEIYNHQQIRRELTKHGRTFTTQSDTEVLAELIDTRGADGLAHLNGMFAFAAYSPRENAYLLARDRIGEKPLYYAESADGFLYFASEIDALLASKHLPAVIDETAVSDYLFYGYVPDPKTIYRNIHKLPPGHYIRIQKGEPSFAPRRWWQMNLAPDSRISFDDAVDQLIPLLDQVVGDQMMADVPLAAFLSGGVDSSAIVTSMQSHTDQAVTTCAMGFDDPRHDERSHAREVADLFSTDHREAVVTMDAAALLPLIASVYGEPFADTSAVPTTLLCNIARDHATVALSGDGGDEIFAGYDRYLGVLREAQLRAKLPSALRHGVLGPLGKLYPALPPSMPRPLRLRTVFQTMAEDGPAGYARAVSAILPDRCEQMLASNLQGYRPQTHVESAIALADTDDPILQAQAADFATWLPGRMLVKVDRASMASSLEVRPPLLDYRMVEWAATLPRDIKAKNGVGKRVLKSALEPHLPENILYRPKQGFGSPVDRWFRDRGGVLLDQLNAASAWQDSGFFNVDEVQVLSKKHRSGRENHGQALWSILAFDAFLTRNQQLDRTTLKQARIALTPSSNAHNVS